MMVFRKYLHWFEQSNIVTLEYIKSNKCVKQPQCHNVPLLIIKIFLANFVSVGLNCCFEKTFSCVEFLNFEAKLKNCFLFND